MMIIVASYVVNFLFLLSLHHNDCYMEPTIIVTKCLSEISRHGRLFFSSQATMHDFLEILDARLRSKPGHVVEPVGGTVVAHKASPFSMETYKKWSKFSAFCCCCLSTPTWGSHTNNWTFWTSTATKNVTTLPPKSWKLLIPTKPGQQTFHLDCPWNFLVNLRHGINASAVLCGTKTTPFPPLHH